MVSTLTEHYERQAERNKKRSDEDYDEGVEEQLVDEDDEVRNNWTFVPRSGIRSSFWRQSPLEISELSNL